MTKISQEHRHPARRVSALSPEQCEAAAAIFRAASDPQRLALLVRLAEGEWCVTELAEAAGSGMSTVSQQLTRLRSERLVTRRRSGKHIFYALADEHILELIRSALAHASEAPRAPASRPTSGLGNTTHKKRKSP